MAFTKGKSMAADFRAAKNKRTKPKNDRQRLFREAIDTAKKTKKGVAVYVGYSQEGISVESLDKMHRAKLPGYRVSKSGNLYFENRKNRSDKSGKRI